MQPTIKIISGGQTGVDLAALVTARAAGIPTGGWLPYGCVNLDGIHDEYKELYDMVECQDPGYGARTELNVLNSDGTLRFAKTFSSPGERCTIAAIHKHNKPHLDISWKPKDRYIVSAASVVEWLIQHEIKTLNVAGNSEKTSPGIYNAACEFLNAVFIRWMEQLTVTKTDGTRDARNLQS